MTPHRFLFRSSMGEFEVVPAYQYDALAARLAEAERLLRDAGPWLEVNYRGARELDSRIDAFLAATDSAADRDDDAL